MLSYLQRNVKETKKKLTLLFREEKDAKLADKKWVMDIVNTYLCSKFWQTYFKPDAMLCFKRDWEIGGVPFRTTWSSGWFIDTLQRYKGVPFSIKYPQMAPVIDDIEQKREQQEKLKTTFCMNHSKVAFYVNDMVKSQIDNIDEMATKVVAVAKAKGKIADAWMKDLEEQLRWLDGATEATALKGWEFRLKKKESIARKLDSAIARMLLMNAPKSGDGSYAPLEAEIVRQIRDGLRYTFIIDLDAYYEGIQKIERVIERHGCLIEAKNYWQHGSMYMGLNMKISMPPDGALEHFKDHRFPLELQVHTPESFELKMGKSHELYEDIRTEAVKKRKKNLVKESIALWAQVSVPKNENGDSFADYEGSHGQFKKLVKEYVDISTTNK